MSNRVDLNCDMGESFGAWKMGSDADVLPYVTSANIACGAHAGDPGVMRATIAMARAQNVAVGAHPGFPDLVGFGRRNMDLSPDDVYDLVVYQVGALSAFAKAAGTELQHVKPHGALYNMAAANRDLASAIVHAVRDVDAGLVVFGLPGSHLISEGEAAGLATAAEAFADRNYLRDGSLVSRRRPDAFVHDVAEAAQRALRMVRDHMVHTVDGDELRIRVDTLCIHGDGPHAAEFARMLRQTFDAEGIAVRPIGRRVMRDS